MGLFDSVSSDLDILERLIIILSIFIFSLIL